MAKENLAESRLVLGTAQLGMGYGIANKTGKPDVRTAEAIIEAAWEGGVREFDTAQAYGGSEKTLGRVLNSLGIRGQARIISKLNPRLDHIYPSALHEALEESLEHLGIAKLYGLMLHREKMLDLWHKGLGEILLDFVAVGLVEHIGISVYSPQKALDAFDTEGIDMVQAPSNILDRRFENAGIFESAEIKSKQIFVRSVFLQGLLLLDSDEVPPCMFFASEILKTFKTFAEKAGVSREQLALGFAKEAYPKAKIIFGAETPQQVKTNLESWESALPWGIVKEARELFRGVEERVLDATLWPN
jgi:aryl-alcohol dehydrogenase-like predicted oxidoreductase